jgi:hypothetical protein
LKDERGAVTTGLLSAVGYLKDNRLLPHGFDKGTASQEIAVRGDALQDPDFNAEGDRVHYAIELGTARGPCTVSAELWYQPIGYRWANNLKPYHAAETERFVAYYDSMAQSAATVLTSAKVVEVSTPVSSSSSARGPEHLGVSRRRHLPQAGAPR